MCQRHPVQEPCADLPVRRRFHLEVADVRSPAEQNVVATGHLRWQLRMLWYIGDQPGQLAVAKTAGPPAVQRDGATSVHHPAYRPQEGRLSRAVRPDQADPFPGGHCDADRVERHGAAEPDPKIIDRDHAKSCLARRDRSTNRKNGAPTAAVMTPIGTSAGAWTVLAAMSASTRNAAPPIMEAGSTTR